MLELEFGYLQSILSDPSIKCIEIWDKVLYVRKWKGKNYFAKKLRFSYGGYKMWYRFEDYKKLMVEFHPDKIIKDKRKNEYYTSICQEISRVRDSILFQERSIDAIYFYGNNTDFEQYSSIISSEARDKFSWKEKSRFLDHSLKFLYRRDGVLENRQARCDEDNRRRVEEGNTQASKMWADRLAGIQAKSRKQRMRERINTEEVS